MLSAAALVKVSPRTCCSLPPCAVMLPYCSMSITSLWQPSLHGLIMQMGLTTWPAGSPHALLVSQHLGLDNTDDFCHHAHGCPHTLTSERWRKKGRVYTSCLWLFALLLLYIPQLRSRGCQPCAPSSSLSAPAPHGVPPWDAMPPELILCGSALQALLQHESVTIESIFVTSKSYKARMSNLLFCLDHTE